MNGLQRASGESASAPGSSRAGLHRRLIQSFKAVIIGCLFFSGCARSGSHADLVIVNGNEPESLDPAIITDISDMRITKAVFEGLVRLDATNALASPGLAKRWDVTPDGKIYTFHLRTNAIWSTGEPITSEDVVYSWMRALSPETGGDY